MSNFFNSLPLSFDTDFVSFKAHQTLQTPGFGLRVFKIMLIAAASTSAGTVTIIDPVDSTVLYPPVGVAASAAAGTIILNDDMDNCQLQWRDFSISGLTATKTRLLIWYRV